MRLRVTGHPVADGSRLGRVLDTGPMLRRTFFHPPDLWVGYLYANRADLLRLGALFRVAASSPHSAVHVPAAPGPGPLDARATPLLVAREDTGLRPSDWPALRRGMRRGGTPLTVTAPAPRSADRPDRVQRLSERHPARLAEHAGACFVLARPELLFWLGDSLTAAGEAVAGDPGIHRRGESFLQDLVGFFATGRPDDPMHALCLVAADPIFHRARWQRQQRRAGGAGRRGGPSQPVRVR
ncbi:hypothetical protein [Kitasatospora phosalacinea]|uniref:Uncharacterized protein n=1 Tax=Kitasatospora phosalacinea TaxID=2065 RepID=A0A9W6PKX0_9ACTN|nr:hypothetical protein [Kitasatospora phosalacinea]GLW56931.1 hypothetical protein Kpho01_49420 [Kitasatospora phosalacinea]